MQKVAFIRRIKEEAVRALSALRLSLPVAVFLTLLFFAALGTFFATDALASVLLRGRVALVLSLLLSLVVLCSLFFPLWYGLKELLICALMCGRTEFERIFSCFRDKTRYLRALWRGAASLLRLSLALFLIYALTALGDAVGGYLVAAGRSALALTVLLVSLLLAVFSSYAVFRWQTDGFLIDALLASSATLTLAQTRAVSVSRMKTGRAALARLRRSFLPLWALSFLLLGIPLFFVFPYYLTARARLAIHLINV